MISNSKTKKKLSIPECLAVKVAFVQKCGDCPKQKRIY